MARYDDAFASHKRFAAVSVLLGTLAPACSGGNSFTATPSQPDGSVPSGPVGPDDGGVVVVVGPNADAMSPEDASVVDAEMTTTPDAGNDDAQPDAAKADATFVPSCSISELACGGRCIPIDTSNCGACGTACSAPDGGTATCTEASQTYSCGIACNAGLTHCGGACVDTQSDPGNCGRCGHGCVSGQCAAGLCESWLVANATASSAGLPIARGGMYGAVDMATDGTNVVWIDPSQGVLEVPAAGGGATTNLSPMQYSSTVTPVSLAMGHGVVVWTTSDVSSNGSGVSLWVAQEGAANSNSGVQLVSLGTDSAGDLPSGLALDATAANAYFIDTENNNGSPKHPGLYKCNLANKSCAVLYSASQPSSLLLADDIAMLNSHLFWTDSLDGEVLHANYATNAMGTAVGQQGGPCLLTLDSTYVYWADVALTDAGTGPASFSISRTSQATPGTVTPVVPTTSGSVGGMGSDGAHVYFIQRGAGQVGLLKYVAADGSAAPQSLKDAQQAYALAVGGGAVYWLNGDNTIDGIAAP